MDCIFCQIAKGESPAHVVWEDERHIAFLSIFPNTPGVTVVITKEHYDSYAFALPDEVLAGLVLAAKTVAQKIDAAFEDVGRTGMVFEGFGVNHIHAKLFPLHGTNDSEWKQYASPVNSFFEKYPGYICSNDSVRADDASLAELAKQIKNNMPS